MAHLPGPASEDFSRSVASLCARPAANRVVMQAANAGEGVILKREDMGCYLGIAALIRHVNFEEENARHMELRLSGRFDQQGFSSSVT